MEPVTHLLMGAVLARTGFNRRAAYATWAMAICAELPDIDMLWGFGGPVTGFEHHRGITHTFLAGPFEALAVVGYFWLTDRWRRKRPEAPLNWAWLFGGCWLALLSHLLLDWTNNYGIRPFFPFNPHWYAGSFVFIFEPVMFVLLLGALVMPALLGLVGSEVGAKRDKFKGRAWAVTALVLLGALYVWRYTEHEKAVELERANAPEGTESVFASPHPINPFLWSTVSATESLDRLDTVNTRTGTVELAQTLYKPPVTLAMLRAKRSYLGRAYMDWAMYPVVSEAPDVSDPRHPLALVTFEDARFMYGLPELGIASQGGIPGAVLIDMASERGDGVVEMRMSGRVQK